MCNVIKDDFINKDDYYDDMADEGFEDDWDDFYDDIADEDFEDDWDENFEKPICQEQSHAIFNTVTKKCNNKKKKRSIKEMNRGIERVLNWDNNIFKKNDLVKVEFKNGEESETQIGRLSEIYQNGRIEVDCSKEYYSTIYPVKVQDIINIELYTEQ